MKLCYNRHGSINLNIEADEFIILERSKADIYPHSVAGLPDNVLRINPSIEGF
jgi:hypothetical protein